ncbi:hypothetical protein [Ferrovum sp.]|uniref:hypothetical protein n=1 Tax=Ferrovum sp. TaxID=2609467 RepID=UPI0026074579|nr:hypothetical protein [Ferrovum sp.]
MNDVESNKVFPVEASESPKNGYSLWWCEYGHLRPIYAVCLNRIKKINSGEFVPGAWNACARALKHSVCPAAKLRAEELAAGRAIYLSPPPIEFQPCESKFTTQPPFRSPPSFSTRRTEIVSQSPLSSTDEIGYAAAINAAVKSSVSSVD